MFSWFGLFSTLILSVGISPILGENKTFNFEMISWSVISKKRFHFEYFLFHFHFIVWNEWFNATTTCVLFSFLFACHIHEYTIHWKHYKENAEYVSMYVFHVSLLQWNSMWYVVNLLFDYLFLLQMVGFILLWMKLYQFWLLRYKLQLSIFSRFEKEKPRELKL